MNQSENKIAFLLSSLKFGGGERAALNLAYALKSRGYQVDFLLMRLEGEFLAEAQQNFNVVHLACNRTWKLPLKLAAYLWRQRPTALITSFWKLNLCGCLARIAYLPVRLVVWEHSQPSLSKNSPTVLYAITASLLYRLATRVVAVSTEVRDDIERITFGLRTRIKVIFNPIPPPLDRNIPLKRSASEVYSIIWVGRLDDPKNPGLMLEAFARLPRNITVVLDFVGDGSLRPSLELHAAKLGLTDRVRFLGFQPAPYSQMQSADMLVLTSDREGLGNVLVEALYCGLRVVSTDCGGIRDVLLDSVYGEIVPVGDADALAQAIVHSLQFPPDPNNQVLGAQRFLPTAIANQFLQAMAIGAHLK